MVDGTTPQVDPLVAALALDQRTVEQMLRDHVDDATGHCAGCNADAPTQSLCGGFPFRERSRKRVGGWPGRSLGSCLTRPVGSHHKGDPPGRPARLEVAHRVRCGV